MSNNAFTQKPAQSFAVSLQPKNDGKAGGRASARKSGGIAVPSLSNLRGVPQTQRRAR